MASSFGWLHLLSSSRFPRPPLSPFLSSELKLAFPSQGSFLSQVRMEQDPGGIELCLNGWRGPGCGRTVLAWPGHQHLGSSVQKPHPLSWLVLFVVHCGLLALSALSTSVMQCHPSSTLATAILSPAQANPQLLWNSAPLMSLRACSQDPPGPAVLTHAAWAVSWLPSSPPSKEDFSDMSHVFGSCPRSQASGDFEA